MESEETLAESYNDCGSSAGNVILSQDSDIKLMICPSPPKEEENNILCIEDNLGIAATYECIKTEVDPPQKEVVLPVSDTFVVFNEIKIEIDIPEEGKTDFGRIVSISSGNELYTNSPEEVVLLKTPKGKPITNLKDINYQDECEITNSIVTENSRDVDLKEKILIKRKLKVNSALNRNNKNIRRKTSAFEDSSSDDESSSDKDSSTDSDLSKNKDKDKKISTKTIKLCFKCGKSFSSISALNVHRSVHTGERPFPCTFCDKRFRFASNLKTHQSTHTDEKPYKCSFCKDSFRLSNTLKIHELTHTDDGRYKCVFCKKSFHQLSRLKLHEQYHIKDTYKCSVCENGFKSKYDCKRHEKTHFKEKETPYKCELCNIVFTVKKDFKAHRTTHDDKNVFKCFICNNRAFSSEAQLNVHKTRSHGVKKVPHQCSFCDKTFRNTSHKKEHERIHTGEKPYKCSFCEKTFAVRKVAKLHERIHSGEKPYKCSLCDRAFVQAYNLKSHEMTHGVNREEFQCSLCEKKFASVRSLKKHASIQH